MKTQLSCDTIFRKHFCKARSDLEGFCGITFRVTERHLSKCTKTIRKEKASLCIWSLLSASRHLLSQTLWILRSRLSISLMEYFDLYMSLKIARIYFLQKILVIIMGMSSINIILKMRQFSNMEFFCRNK